MWNGLKEGVSPGVAGHLGGDDIAGDPNGMGCEFHVFILTSCAGRAIFSTVLVMANGISQCIRMSTEVRSYD